MAASPLSAPAKPSLEAPGQRQGHTTSRAARGGSEHAGPRTLLVNRDILAGISPCGAAAWRERCLGTGDVDSIIIKKEPV